MVYVQPRIWDSEIQTDHLISAKRTDLVIVNKRKKKEKKREENLSNSGLCRSGWPQGKTEGKRKVRQIPDLARELESDSDTNSNWCARYSYQRINTGTRWLENKMTSRDHPNYSIIKIGQNTEKSPGDWRRLTVAQTPVRNYQLTLVWKILKEIDTNPL